MILANKSVVFVTALLIIALAGLIAVQMFLINFALELKEQAFDHNVSTALSTVAQQAEAAELAKGVANIMMFDSPDDGHVRRFRSIHSESMAMDTVKVDTLNYFSLEWRNEIEALASGLHPSLADTTATVAIIVQTSRQPMMNKVVGDMTRSAMLPISERVAQANLDSLLSRSLEEVGIEIGYHYGVVSSTGDSLQLSSDSRHNDQLRKSTYRASLFPLDMMTPHFDLVVCFPGGQVSLYKQLWPLLVSSFIFTLLIIFSFAHTIRMIAAQRRLSGQMVDFINNMTHEFKTPISTVALACEAMSRPDVLEQHETMLRYNRMIRDENTRMHKQVEKILQMAQLERGEYELNIQPVDVHALITRVSDNTSLQLEQCRGQLDVDLAAQEHHVMADVVHLTNVIQNLLDNAMKYSLESPDVSVRTWNQGQMLGVRVSDKGIGIAEHDHKRVFEKYFRCHTGNRHDVKGFGLGLSYVKLMVEAHGGDVGITSRPGSGTSIDVILPLVTTTDSGSDHD